MSTSSNNNDFGRRQHSDDDTLFLGKILHSRFSLSFGDDLLEVFLYMNDCCFVRSSFVFRVRRIFLDGPVYMGREVFSALFELSPTSGVRRTTGKGTGTTGRTHIKIPTPTAHLMCAAANS